MGGLIMQVADEMSLYFQYDIVTIKGQDLVK